MNRLALMVMLLALAGCSTSAAILLPDQDGKVGALVLKHGKTEQLVDRAYMQAQDGVFGDTVNVAMLTQQQVEQRYGATLRAEPAPAASFTLYFMEGTTELTEESKAQLSAVAATYKAHAPAKVYIIGHTDRTGSAELNMQLALDRAKTVEQQLKSSGAGFDTFEVRSFGENDPLVPTAKGVAEPRNRRVEILIL
jgi:OOP family OmpA-OmpF porin